MSNSLKEAFLSLASSLGHCQENSRSIVDVLKRGCNDLANNSEGGSGGSGHTYSTTEQKIGKWIDGHDLYQITINTGSLPNASQKSTAHGISNIDMICSIEGVAYDPTKAVLPMGYVNVDSVTYDIQLEVSKTDIVIKTGIDFSSYTGYVTIRYTKIS